MKPAKSILSSSFFVLLACCVCVGQTNKKQESKQEKSILGYKNPTTETWEFGLEITAGAPVRGITATVPVPIDWPEQKLSELPVTKSKSVSQVRFKNPGPGVRQMIIKINRLAAGESAKIIFNVKIEKKLIVAPSDTSKLKFVEKPSSKIRKYLSPSPFIESRHAKIKKIAEEMEFEKDATPWEQVETIYKWVRANVKYKFDTQIHSCIDALKSGQGDCEELSSLFIAICRAKGIPARAVWIPEHTYPEFYLVDEKGNGHWIPCQAAGDYEFGSMTEYRPILQKGDKFRIAGHKKPMRYVQPTLIARDAEGAPSMKWIMNRVKSQAKSPKSKSGDKK